MRDVPLLNRPKEGKTGGTRKINWGNIHLRNSRDFPGGTVDKTLHSQCRGPRCLIPGQGTRSHTHAATKSSHATTEESECHNWGARVPQLRSPRATTTEAHVPRAHALQQEKPPQ